MIEIDGDKFYKPREIADEGLILNSKGNKDYRFVLRLIESGRLEARQWNDSKKLPYYVVSQKEIKRFNSSVIKKLSRKEANRGNETEEGS